MRACVIYCIKLYHFSQLKIDYRIGAYFPFYYYYSRPKYFLLNLNNYQEYWNCRFIN